MNKITIEIINLHEFTQQIIAWPHTKLVDGLDPGEFLGDPYHVVLDASKVPMELIHNIISNAHSAKTDQEFGIRFPGKKPIFTNKQNTNEKET